jgi:hypothetical protein
VQVVAYSGSYPQRGVLKVEKLENVEKVEKIEKIEKIEKCDRRDFVISSEAITN